MAVFEVFLAAGETGAEAAKSTPWIFSNIWLIPAIPAVSFLLIIMFGKRLPMKGSEIGLASIAAVFALSMFATGTWVNDIGVTGGHSESGDHSKVSEDDGKDADHSDSGDHSEDSGDHSEDSGDHSDDEASAVVIQDGDDQIDAQLVAGDVEARGSPIVKQRRWFGTGDLEFNIGTLVDGQSVMMLFVVSIISGLVHLYSTDYVNGDRRYTHYFAFLSLFTSAMLFMVLSSSTLQLIVGWELVGVCSFALIGHWWEDKPNSDAALKAFLTNRVGDIGLLVGMIILYFEAGNTFDIGKINAAAIESPDNRMFAIAALCLMAAVMSKSGQFILHTWLPDAMAGPTPVSALIHAATMVVAGVYMIGRLYPVFWHGLSMPMVDVNAMALIGGITTVGGGLLAFVQRDIKKVLAYSTVSQLGYMVLALGMGAYTAGMFHLFTHAFFKACLFLGAGSVSHACHHSFDMKADMGGLRKYMPKTFWTFMIGTGALMGIPPLAGFWSKDEILVGAQVWPGTASGAGLESQGEVFAGVAGNGSYLIPFIFGCITAALTAAYMTRVIMLTFFGKYRGHEEPHESGARITIPLIILAAMASVVGFLNMPSGFVKFLAMPEGWAHRFEDWVEPAGISTFPKIDHAKPSLSLAMFATGLGAIAIVLVYNYYSRLFAKNPDATEYTAETGGIASKVPVLATLHRVLDNKYYLDHLYTGVITGATKGPVARAAYWFNQNVLDGVVNAFGKVTVVLGRLVYRFIDQGVVDNAVNTSGKAASESGQFLRGIQSGQVRQYATLMFGATAVLVAVFVFAIQ